MTDKELKKLSRLELLELLLEASKENSKLRQEIERLQEENQTAQNIANLSVITLRVENALKYANSLTDVLKEKSGQAVLPTSNTKDGASLKFETLSDREIYWRMLFFFAQNSDKLNIFPADIENDIRERIKSVLKKEI